VISIHIFSLLMGLGVIGLISSTVFTGLVFAGAYRFAMARRRHRETAPSRFCPPVSLLKPLHGDEPNLETHIVSFFEQDYPHFEILFCARYANDPGLQTARRVAARYPSVPARFLTTGEPSYINAKVSSLEKMAAAAGADIFIISDSDVRVTPNYIREVVAPFERASVGAVTCLYRGVADEGIWSKLEAAGMSIEMTSGVVVANMMEGMKFTLGPTMAVRRSCVDEMGGFPFLGPYCADDFVLGHQVASVKHQVRWMKSTRFSRPKGHFGTSLTFAVPFGLLACLAAWGLGRPHLGFALLGYSIAARMLMAAVVGSAVVQERHLLRTTLLFPLRDLFGFFYWAASYTDNTVVWRSQIYRLTEGGLMQATAEDAHPKREPIVTA
jgi:ceramide glucosyltransferase